MNAWIIQRFEGIDNNIISLMKHERDVVAAINKWNAPRTPARLQIQLAAEVPFSFPGMAIMDEPAGTVFTCEAALTFPLVDTRGLRNRLAVGLACMKDTVVSQQLIVLPGFCRTLVLWKEEAQALHDAILQHEAVFEERYDAFYKTWCQDNGMPCRPPRST